MQNKPNFQNFQMFVKLVKSRNYNYEQRTMNYELLFKNKPNQTQSCPPLCLAGLSASGGFKRYAYCSDLLLSLERKVRMSE